MAAEAAQNPLLGAGQPCLALLASGPAVSGQRTERSLPWASIFISSIFITSALWGALWEGQEAGLPWHRGTQALGAS